MKLTFFGGAQTTTGSMYLLEIGNRRVLIECGMYQGRRAESIARNSTLPFDAEKIDAMLLSHAHIDHSGVIPVLCKNGFNGKIFATDATVDLCNIMLMDSAYIQEQDAAFVTKKNLKKGLPPAEPLYTQADANASLEHLESVPYNKPAQIFDGFSATWLDAGHILGSAMLILDIEERGKRARFAFSGDIGRGHNDILRDPDHPRDADFLMMESTYGNRQHEDLADVNKRVCDIVNRAAERGGKIIIPSFAVGRTQQLLYTMYALTEQKCIPRLPIYVDSPLSINATEVFKRHPECFNKKFYDVMMNSHNPFSMPNLTCVTAVEDSMALNDKKGPFIIISASGMAEAGRIRHHLKNNIGDEKNIVLIVGFCAAHTLGARLMAGDKQVNIFGEPYKVRARVESFSAFSAHADKNELRQWAENCTGALKKIILVHGEPDQQQPFAETLRKLRPKSEILVPNYKDSVEL
jgi:metallo-beta-lactamase family protein